MTTIQLIKMVNVIFPCLATIFQFSGQMIDWNGLLILSRDERNRQRRHCFSSKDALWRASNTFISSVNVNKQRNQRAKKEESDRLL